MKFTYALRSFILTILTANFSAAQTSVTAREVIKKPWTTEAVFNTISNSSSPTFGPGLLYRIDELNQVGTRILAPLGSQEGTISVMAIYRHSFGFNRTHLFLEGSAGSNWYASKNPKLTVQDSSIGTNLGVTHNLNEDISFGGLAGIEWTRTRLGQSFASNDSDSISAWGRIALFTSLHF